MITSQLRALQHISVCYTQHCSYAPVLPPALRPEVKSLIKVHYISAMTLGGWNYNLILKMLLVKPDLLSCDSKLIALLLL